MHATNISSSLLSFALLVSSNPLPIPESQNDDTSNGTSTGYSSTPSKGGCQFAGVNIAGFDFGADNSVPPLSPLTP